MPNVKEGSMVEYSYTIQSDFLFDLREWEFQNTIPVAWSEYRVTIPEYFKYRLLSSLVIASGFFTFSFQTDFIRVFVKQMQGPLSDQMQVGGPIVLSDPVIIFFKGKSLCNPTAEEKYFLYLKG